MTIQEIISQKGKRKLAMLTCYDAAFAAIIDKTNIDIILVGDSLANVVLGLDETKEVSFEEMFNHTRAVAKSAAHTLVIADMPYISYQDDHSKALFYAKKFIEEAGADAVKVEWFSECLRVVEVLVKNNIPVMGHIGLTPQTAQELGGLKVQGRNFKAAITLYEEARKLQRCGAFSIVLECIPQKVAKTITEALTIPTIGIGAGKMCDGQVLVLYDMLGLYKKVSPKFVRRYVDLEATIEESIKRFVGDVEKEVFPSKDESFLMKKEEYERFRNSLDF